MAGNVDSNGVLEKGKLIIKTTVNKIMAKMITLSLRLFGQLSPYSTSETRIAGSHPIGGGTPITGGLLILLSLGTGYGIKKVYEYRERLSE